MSYRGSLEFGNTTRILFHDIRRFSVFGLFRACATFRKQVFCNLFTEFRDPLYMTMEDDKVAEQALLSFVIVC